MGLIILERCQVEADSVKKNAFKLGERPPPLPHPRSPALHSYVPVVCSAAHLSTISPGAGFTSQAIFFLGV